jgi:hypothetical protein
MVISVGPPPPVKEPSPEHIAAGLGVRSVSLDLASIGATLQPDTTYHYRVIAANTSNGQTVEGSDQTFTTAALAGTASPLIENQAPASTTPTETTPHKSSVRTVKPPGSRSKKHVKIRRRKKPKKRDRKARRHKA